MKISIDTSQDSHEDIKKAIKLLMSLVEGPVYSNDPDQRNIFENPPAPSQPQSIFNIFDNPVAEKIDEKKKDSPDIEFY